MLRKPSEIPDSNAAEDRPSCYFSPGLCYNVRDASLPPLSVLLLGNLLVLRFSGFLIYFSSRHRELVVLVRQ